MDPTFQLVFYVIALILFGVSGVLAAYNRHIPLLFAAAGGVAVAIPLIWNTAQYV